MIYQYCPWGHAKPKLDAKKLKTSEKRWLGERVAKNPQAAHQLADRYGLDVKCLQQYGRNIKQKKGFQSVNGRPKLLSDEEEKAVVNALSNLTYQEVDDKYMQMLREAADRTALERQHINRVAAVPSRRWRGRFEKRNDIVSANAVVTTDARAVACADLRNAVSFAAMNQLVLHDYNVKSELILNVDGSAFTVGKGCGMKERVRFVRGKRPTNIPVKVRVQSNKPNRLPYTQKAHILISAGGYQAPPIYIVPDAKMPKQDIDTYKVDGLGVGTDITNHGHIVFMQTRGGNDKFFKWFTETALVSFVREIRKAKGYEEDSWAYLLLDGEDAQIKVYQDMHLREVLEKEHIILGKPAASTSEITQACDRQDVFRAPKGINRQFDVTPLIIDYSVHSAIADVLKAHLAKYKRKTNPAEDLSQEQEDGVKKGFTLGTAHQQQVIEGIARVQMAFANGVHPHTIRDSFKLIGVHPYSLHQILSECRAEVSEDEETHIMEVMPKLVQKIRDQGELFDSDFDKENIRNLAEDMQVGKRGRVLKGRVKKDSLVIGRRRAVLLLHPRVSAKEVVRVQTRNAKKEATAAKRAAQTAQRR